VGDELEILWLAVDPGVRRQGMGRSLVRVVLAEAQAHRAHVHLELRASNVAARALYAELGFVVVGRRSRYYRDGEDALQMTRALEGAVRTVDRGATPSDPDARAADLAPSSTASDESLAPLRMDAEVIRNDPESAGSPNLRLVLRSDAWPGFQPGQFAMLSPGAVSEAPRSDPLLPRPMAVYQTRALGEAGGTEIEILYKRAGRGTALLAEARPGERVRLVGPLGNPFPLPAPGERALLVGGGTGTASLLELARLAAERGPVEVLLGARSASDLMGRLDFASLDAELFVATEDGSDGIRGLVTRLLEERLESARSEAVCVYACGPTPMMRACAELASQAGRRCWVSLENTMACGFGVCLGCAMPLEAGGFGLVCRAGPVFESGAVVWEGLP
jgi:dihydroorotate dehydrogenase electron transfer subunit